MPDNIKFRKLMEPGTIGRIKTRNRMIRVAAGTDYIDEEGILKDKQEVPYFEALARGGIGLIIVQASSLVRLGDKNVPGYRKVTEVAHKYGCPIFANFHHSGGWVTRPRDPSEVVSASAIPLEELQLRGPDFPIVPRELTIPEIKEIINELASAAERAREAGFDGIDFNSATCHLGNSFLSRAWNRRQDIYGCQNLMNRTRFVVELKDTIKNRLGQDFPVGILINGAEFGIKDGLTSEETQGIARILEKAGFDYINVRVYGYMDYFDLHVPDSIYYPEPPKPLAKPLDGSRNGVGIGVPLAVAIKKVVSIPVITVGRLNAELGEELLEQGEVDFIGLGRPLIADPEYPNKVAAGKLEDIAPCTYCMTCFGRRVDHGLDMKCRINAAIGSEDDYVVIPPADKKKKVVVVGAGPAGLEAARVAALRGHEVTVYDRGKKPGGLLPLAGFVRGLEVENLEDIISYFNVQLDNLGVSVRLKTEVDDSLIEQIKPDVVILATGGTPTIPDIPGIERRIVLTVPALHRRVKGYLNFFGSRLLRFLTIFYLPVGKRVIVMGGGLQGGEVAEFMVKRGRQVTLVDTAETLEGENLPKARTLRLFRWFDRNGVTMMTGVTYEEITDKGLVITDRDGNRQILEADSIIPVMPWEPNTELFDKVQGKVPEVYAIGDCREPNLILDAVADGYWTARSI